MLLQASERVDIGLWHHVRTSAQHLTQFDESGPESHQACGEPGWRSVVCRARSNSAQSAVLRQQHAQDNDQTQQILHRALLGGRLTGRGGVVSH